MDKLVHPAILKRDAHHETFGGYGDIQVLGYLSCDVLDCHGNLQLDDVLDVAEVQYVGGHLSAIAIAVDGDVNVKGEVFSETDIAVNGGLFAGEVICQGNLNVGSVHSHGDISAWGTIRAVGQITSLNGEIHSGRWIATKVLSMPQNTSKQAKHWWLKKESLAVLTTASWQRPRSSVPYGRHAALFLHQPSQN